jgi:CDP-alcohol phosphatidyltransferase
MGLGVLIPVLIFLNVMSSSFGSSFSTKSKLVQQRREKTLGTFFASNVNYGGSTVQDDSLGPSASLTNAITKENQDEEGKSVNVPSSSNLGPKSVSPGFIRSAFPTFPWHQLPNWLTFARCLAIPGLIVVFYAPGRHLEASLLFAFASLTDWLDGYLARRWDVSSAFGAFLDPVVSLPDVLIF